MTLVVDSAPLVALANKTDPKQSVIDKILREENKLRALPEPVVTEVDYLLGKYYGRIVQRNFMADIASGFFQLEPLDKSDFAKMLELDDRYADLKLGVADLSIVIVAERLRTTRLLTFDERDFRSVTPIQGGSFELLPADC